MKRCILLGISFILLLNLIACAVVPEETVLLSDHFDLDAVFAEAKAEGWFEEYETMDELFEANMQQP